MAGLLDGAWWPYSRDLATELPPLVDALREALAGEDARETEGGASSPPLPTPAPSSEHA